MEHFWDLFFHVKCWFHVAFIFFVQCMYSAIITHSCPLFPLILALEAVGFGGTASVTIHLILFWDDLDNWTTRVIVTGEETNTLSYRNLSYALLHTINKTKQQHL